MRSSLDRFVNTASIALLGLAVFGTGCTGDVPPANNDPVVSIFELVTPTGFVTGQVVDGLTGAALSGVTVTLIATDESATTDDVGTFRFENVPASTSIAVRYTLSGYAPAIDTVTIPSSAGTLAQNNGVAFSGPIGMLETSAGEVGVRPRLLVRQGETIATDAVVSSRLNVAYFVDGAAQGILVGAAQVEGEAYVVEGYPDLQALAVAAPFAQIRIAVTPTGDDYRPTFLDLSVGDVLSRGVIEVDLEPVEEPVIEPDPEPTFVEGDAVAVTESNVVDLVDAGSVLPTVLNAGEAVSVVFNRPIRNGTFFADAIDGAGDPVSATVTTADNLTFQIALGATVAGQEIRLRIDGIADAPASEGIAPFLASGIFFIADAAPLTIISAVFADQNDLDQAACPNQNNARLVLELSAAIGGRRLNNGVAVAVGPDDFLAVGGFTDDGPGFGLLNNIDGDPIRAVLQRTSGNGSGFQTRLVIQGDQFANYPNQPVDGITNVTLTIRFNDLTIDEDLNGGDTVLRRPSGEALDELVVTTGIVTDGC